jgi:hypothetical protein
MRVTLNLDDDLEAALRRYAKDRHISMRKAASELVRRGLDRPFKTRLVNGFYVLDLPAGSAEVTEGQVRELQG